MTYDLTSADGLSDALDAAGSWAALSRDTDIPVSTLKSRGNRLGVRLGVIESFVPEEVEEFAHTIAHWIVALVIEHEKGMPIEKAWQLFENMVRRSVEECTMKLLYAQDR